MIPSYPREDTDGIPYTVNSIRYKVVSEYAVLSMREVLDLDVFSFWGLLRDAVIYNNSQTKDGREWLWNAWRLNQTEPETGKLRSKFGKGGT